MKDSHAETLLEDQLLDEARIREQATLAVEAFGYTLVEAPLENRWKLFVLDNESKGASRGNFLTSGSLAHCVADAMDMWKGSWQLVSETLDTEEEQEYIRGA